MAKLNDRCFCCSTAAKLVSLGRAPTWRFHTKLYTFRWNSFPNNAGMKNRTDLNLGEVLCLSIVYHILDSWLNLLNGDDFYFRCKPPIRHRGAQVHLPHPLLCWWYAAVRFLQPKPICESGRCHKVYDWLHHWFLDDIGQFNVKVEGHSKKLIFFVNANKNLALSLAIHRSFSF